jgi:hypothetical protein
MREFIIAPSLEMEERPVNQMLRTVPVKKALRFEDDERNVVVVEETELLEKCEPFFSNFSQTDPWVKDRAANKERDAIILEKWQKKRAVCSSWKPIYELMINTDESTF